MDRTVPSSALVAWVADASSATWPCNTDATPRHIETWRSRTATLHSFAVKSSTAPDVVVKVYPEATDAQAFFCELSEVKKVVDELTTADFAPVVPLAFSTELGAVMMSFSAGRSLSDVMIEGPWGSPSFLSDLQRYLYNCGLVLARYHDRSSTEDVAARAHAWDNLRNRLQRVLGEQASSRAEGMHIDAGLISKSYGDFHPSHVLASDGGQLALIDPPIEAKYRFAHRDLGLFKYYVYLTLIRPSRPWAPPQRVRHYESLAREFERGYAVGRQRPWGETDQLMTDMYEAFYLHRMLRNVRGRRSYLAYAYYYPAAARRVNSLRRSALRALR